MDGVYLTLFMHEGRRHHGQLLSDWLISLARELDLPGCSVIRAIAGYGHHHRVYRQGLFELQGTLPVEVSFALEAAQADALLARLHAEGVELFYVRMPAAFGFTAASGATPAPPAEPGIPRP